MEETYRSPESFSEKEKWEKLTPAKRVQYIWNYYKLPMVIGLILLYMIGHIAYRQMTKKDVILYTGLVNVAPGGEFCRALSDGFLEALQANQKKEAFVLYTGWYLTDDTSNDYFPYTYASQMKILASIDDEQLDVVLMNREAFDAFSQNGYLCDLQTWFSDQGLMEQLQPYFVNGLEIQEDRTWDEERDSDMESPVVTKEYPMALDLSGVSLFQTSGFEDTIYLGILANTPRGEMIERYLRYLYEIAG